ncbi:4Fe-4S ferredoxin [Pusillimonas sp. T2]|uniref:4Fe-4S binding protein n=1 Tax=Pusillimonas sp. T2 TaxID=1548123 RepID=UPI000B9D4B51|nr:4Fe-4S binding protein [Pusillimonas sp. T2]OXR48540.1 4Fe-4S ferredoxin [Pusillimonas sp. T2]
MIEIVSAERCTACNICVQVCPTNVFEIVKDEAPRIARQNDCQTCFMCELYCPEDALYVAPVADEPVHVNAQDEKLKSLMGSYKKSIGWSKGQTSTAARDHSFELLLRAH